MAAQQVDSAIGTPVSSRAQSRNPSRSRKARTASVDPVCAQCPACKRAAAQATQRATSTSRPAPSSRSSSKPPSVFDVINHKWDVWAESRSAPSSRRASEDVPRDAGVVGEKQEPAPARAVPSTEHSSATASLPKGVASRSHSRAPSSTRSTSQKPDGRRSPSVFEVINHKLDVWVDGQQSRRASVQSTASEEARQTTTCPVHGVVPVDSDDDKENTEPWKGGESRVALTTIQSVGDMDLEQVRSRKIDEEVSRVQEARTSEERDRVLQKVSPDARQQFWSMKNGTMWNYLGTSLGRSCGGI